MELLNEWLAPLGGLFLFYGKWLVISAVIFLPLALVAPGNRNQPLFRKDMLADMMYWFCGPVVYGPMSAAMTAFALNHLYSDADGSQLMRTGLPPLADLPVAVQMLLILLATDLIQYWAHRMFHGTHMWRFHAVHHSSKQVDWLSTTRFHPVNILLYSTTAYVLVGLLGFQPRAFAYLLPFNMLFSPFVHANLDWTLGPLRYVIATPVFHRWHHTCVDEGGARNFAPTFPVYDLLFGTFYMPTGVYPRNFGAPHDTVPDDFFGQLAYPFLKKDWRMKQIQL